MNSVPSINLAPAKRNSDYWSSNWTSDNHKSWLSQPWILLEYLSNESDSSYGVRQSFHFHQKLNVKEARELSSEKYTCPASARTREPTICLDSVQRHAGETQNVWSRLDPGWYLLGQECTPLSRNPVASRLFRLNSVLVRFKLQSALDTIKQDAIYK